ncbi:MAG: anaerobic carbon-monoxide dehydrogenase catalytic subunit [Chloroflexi bacterium]|nr:anaerobic carbon-monoxide dehydrogenase catalytic subunit [Chloroflexota bacterium]
MPNSKTWDPIAQSMIEKANEQGFSTAFSRAEAMKPCPIGRGGSCCSFCFMGPCRMVGKNREELAGICGARPATIAARNLARWIAAGAASHSDHGRDMAIALRETAKGKAQGYEIKDVKKLYATAKYLGVKVEDRTKEEIAIDVANAALEVWKGQEGEIVCLSRAPKRRQEIWRSLGIAPRGVDREIVETLHRTGMGTDQDPEHILMHALRASMTDGWGGSMIATDIGDILFGTPKPVRSKVNLGVLKEDEVNIVVHGHEPLLSEMIVLAASDPESIEYAKSKGANGINLAGICCTANEVLMRQGVPSAGNFLNQELSILTGAVDAMVVDVQCVMQALQGLSTKFHTKLITTSKKAKITGATHIQFDEHKALSIAKLIVKTAIDNYPNRGKSEIPEGLDDLVAGFSHEYISYMLGGIYRASFRALNDAIIEGRIKGVAGIVGCNNPRTVQDQGHNYLTREFISRDVLVVQTGCGAIASAKAGLLTPEALQYAGPGLREVCEAVGIPPVIHLGSCVDNSRILTIATNMVTEGGLGDDIADLPAVGIAPEWMHEKALSIGAYFVASGVYVLFGGGESPVGDSAEVTEIITKGWEEKVGGKLEFEPDFDEILRKSMDHIELKRKALKLGSWAPGKYTRTYVTPQELARRGQAALEE